MAKKKTETKKETAKKPAAKTTTAKKPAAKKPAAKTTTKKETAKPTAKPVAKKTTAKPAVKPVAKPVAKPAAQPDTEKTEPKKSVVISAAKMEAFRKGAISRKWSLHDLTEKAYEKFGKENVEVERLNHQVAFLIEGKRIPEVGYFTVN